MRVVALSTEDGNGGAGRAAVRLHNALRAANVDMQMLVKHKLTDIPSIHAPNWLTKIGYKARSRCNLALTALNATNQTRPYATGLIRGNVHRQVAKWQPDVVHLHWIVSGFVDIWAMTQMPAPVVWTLHDFWAFTGGCHYPQSCDGYLNRCGDCPVLGSQKAHDLSRRVYLAKQKAWENFRPVIVAPSRWLAERACESSLFQGYDVRVIPNCLDVRLFRPKPVPHTKTRILFGAASLDNPLKGFDLLIDALHQLHMPPETTEVLTFGTVKNLPELPYVTKHFGQITDDEELVALYSSADVMVVPSRQEAFGQTASEALACGTPVVAFDVTGLRDIVTHCETGYLAEAYDSVDFAYGIRWVVENRPRLSLAARRRAVAHFSYATVAAQYITLYRELIAMRPPVASSPA